MLTIKLNKHKKTVLEITQSKNNFSGNNNFINLKH